MADTIYKNDTNTVLQFDIGIDSSNVTVAKIYYQKPSGDCGYWNATTVEGTNKIEYVTQDGDINESGNWYLQPYIELASGWKGRGDIIKMKVSKIICDN